MTGPVGHRVWVLPAGRIPFPSNGSEPEFTSFDALCVLNAGGGPAELALTVYYEDAEPVGPYPVCVPARRVRHIRFNDLIDPEALRLDRPFGVVVNSSTPVVVQFSRQDTRLPGSLAIATTLAFPADPGAPITVAAGPGGVGPAGAGPVGACDHDPQDGG
ncbi:sensory rhodopsin transducer [Plantactinospora sp. WMMC1484]|uniref:sensory rhodopsin transducer n=1 Tax=Plantactinospora sp. WMMC1484 TaxID=3404122 RepID=UPI003BF59907